MSDRTDRRTHRVVLYHANCPDGFGAAFAASSVLVPYCFGAVAGGIASGRVPAGGQAGDPVSSWINPSSIHAGILAVAAVAYLAAVYLVWDARRLGDMAMVNYFRRRAVITAAVVGVLGLVGTFVLRADASYLFDGSEGRAAAQTIDRTIRRLPGLEGIPLFQAWIERNCTPASEALHAIHGTAAA